jgi:hypothetical protein
MLNLVLLFHGIDASVGPKPLLEPVLRDPDIV